MNKFKYRVVFLIFLGFISCNNSSDKHVYEMNVIVPPNGFVDCNVNYTNKTDTIQNIIKIQYSCGCMSGTDNEFLLKPYENKQLTFNLRTNNKDSIYLKEIYLITETNNIIELNVKINTKYKIVAYPSNRKIYFNNCSINNAYSTF